MHSKGGIGALHRFLSVEDNIKEMKACEGPVFVSVGCTPQELERAEALRTSGAPPAQCPGAVSASLLPMYRAHARTSQGSTAECVLYAATRSSSRGAGEAPGRGLRPSRVSATGDAATGASRPP